MRPWLVVFLLAGCATKETSPALAPPATAPAAVAAPARDAVAPPPAAAPPPSPAMPAIEAPPARPAGAAGPPPPRPAATVAGAAAATAPGPGTTDGSEHLRACCAACRGAASRDPTGADLSGKECSRYPAEWNGAPGIDDACRAVLDAAHATVGSCRE